MKRFLLMAVLILAALPGLGAETDSLLRRLDAAVADRDGALRRKEARIDSIKKVLGRTSDVSARYALLGNLYNEYLTYSFDSAMNYVSKAETLVSSMKNDSEKARVDVRKALSLATAGHFSQAVNILDSIRASSLPSDIKEEYYSACEWTYGVWAEYSNDRTFAPEFKQKSILYLDSLLDVMPAGTAAHDYRVAEKSMRAGDLENAEKMYLRAAAGTSDSTRLYAQIAYALGVVYKEMGREEEYRDWMIRAAIADQKIPLKENLALQQLALFLKDTDGDLKRSNRYLRCSLEDAIFYNNRLRMLEIAEKIPEITIEYQDMVAVQNKRLTISLLLIAALIVGMGVALWLLVRQVKKRRRAMEEKEKLADQLALMNRRLLDTNRSREQYTSLFVDLCGTYIEKLNRFPMVLKLKVKQLADLNSVAERYVRPSEAEMREMFFNYDTAFLKLYPDFITEFNSLLLPDKRIYPKEKELLGTDLRIYSLVRMGVTDSNRIASLLFYSPQTIFNHRTAVRNRAINRDTFEKDVQQICKVN